MTTTTTSYRCRPIKPFLILCTLTALLSWAAPLWADDGGDFNGDGYRRDHYRAPTPPTAPGATTLTVKQLHHMLEVGQKFGLIDVLPRPPRPEGLAPDAVWMPPAHQDIPGSLWLPDVGQPVLSPEAEAYFRKGIEHSIGHDRAVPVVMYCKKECWMSWNAAKRAAIWGYRVLWYPDGVEGWAEAGYPLVVAYPEPKD